MENDLKPITCEQFNAALAAYQKNRPEGFSGPFIHSAPAGNMFRGPFEERAWMLGPKTVLIKRRAGNGDAEYFSAGKESVS
jgi:hypothetical protein